MTKPQQVLSISAINVDKDDASFRVQWSVGLSNGRMLFAGNRPLLHGHHGYLEVWDIKNRVRISTYYTDSVIMNVMPVSTPGHSDLSRFVTYEYRDNRCFYRIRQDDSLISVVPAAKASTYLPVLQASAMYMDEKLSFQWPDSTIGGSGKFFVSPDGKYFINQGKYRATCYLSGAVSGIEYEDRDACVVHYIDNAFRSKKAKVLFSFSNIFNSLQVAFFPDMKHFVVSNIMGPYGSRYGYVKFFSITENDVTCLKTAKVLADKLAALPEQGAYRVVIGKEENNSVEVLDFTPWVLDPHYGENPDAGIGTEFLQWVYPRYGDSIPSIKINTLASSLFYKGHDLGAVQTSESEMAIVCRGYESGSINIIVLQTYYAMMVKEIAKQLNGVGDLGKLIVSWLGMFNRVPDAKQSVAAQVTTSTLVDSARLML